MEGVEPATFGVGATPGEALQDHIRKYGHARNLDVRNCSIVDVNFAPKTDFTGSRFENVGIRNVTANEGLFNSCLFRNCKIVNLKAEEGDFSESVFKKTSIDTMRVRHGKFAKVIFEDVKSIFFDAAGGNFFRGIIETSKFTRPNFRFARAEGLGMMLSTIYSGDLYKFRLSGSRIRYSSMVDSSGAYSSWDNAVCEHVDFSDFSFVSHKDRSGRRRGVTVDDSTSKYVNDLYANARFHGCKYDGAILPHVENFPKDFRTQRIAASITRTLMVSAGYVGFEAAYEKIRHFVEWVVQTRMIENTPILSSLMHINASAVGYIGAGALLAIAVAGEMQRDKGIEWIDSVVGNGIRHGLSLRANLKAAIENFRNLAIVVGSRRSLRPIRQAMLAARRSWSKRRGSTKMSLTPSYSSVVFGDRQLLVSDRASLEHALTLTTQVLNHEVNPKWNTTVLVRNLSGGPRLRMAALQVSTNLDTRVVWQIGNTGRDITVGWNQRGEVSTVSVNPPSARFKARQFVSRFPDFQRFLAPGGREDAIRAFFDQASSSIDVDTRDIISRSHLSEPYDSHPRTRPDDSGCSDDTPDDGFAVAI